MARESRHMTPMRRGARWIRAPLCGPAGAGAGGAGAGGAGAGAGAGGAALRTMFIHNFELSPTFVGQNRLVMTLEVFDRV